MNGESKQPFVLMREKKVVYRKHRRECKSVLIRTMLNFFLVKSVINIEYIVQRKNLRVKNIKVV